MNLTWKRTLRTNPTGIEFCSSRDFAKVLGYVNYRHFEAVIAKAKTACINSGQQVEDHFVGSDQMIEIGKGGKRAVQAVMMSRYAFSGSGASSQHFFQFRPVRGFDPFYPILIRSIAIATSATRTGRPCPF